MPINKERARAVVDFMNEALAVDRLAVEGLLFHRVPCNAAMADHPTIQVRSYDPPPIPTVSMLGLLNGLCGADEDSIGAVYVDMMEDSDHIAQFRFVDVYADAVEKLARELFPLIKGLGLSGANVGRVTSVIQPVIDEAVEEQKERADGYERLFDQQRKREQPYIELWRRETGKHNVIPDYGEFVKWLCERLEKNK
jgi:hypothetical protein